ncbi:hypothetical protein [Cesiribacter sp. SM1]|uniref:hypothetical protein n=1 Tax=Cesiribacter sp. SM1 TaxID=2861196 RepID=UPI001CD638D4|nr:hypothetical protein [Cesiribacter sp. SM1]
MHYGNQFFPLIRKEDGFVFEGYGAVDHQAVTTAAILGGAVGGAIAGATSGKAKTQEYQLNMFTGNIYSADEEYLAGVTITAPAKLQLYRSDRKQQEEEVILMINDSTTIALRPGSIQELNFLAPLTKLTICDKDAKAACITINPSAGSTYYIEVSLPKKQEASLSVAEVEEKVAQFYLNEIKLAKDK